MISENTWRHILTAPNTTEAVERAAHLSVSVIHGSAIPWSYEELSRRSQANLRAVSRAYDVAITGVPTDGWSAWRLRRDDAKLSYGWEEGTVHVARETNQENEELGDDDRVDEEISANPLVASQIRDTQQPANSKKDNEGHQLQVDADKESKEGAKSSEDERIGAKPSATEVQAAEAVRNWAQEAPHTSPPSEAVETIRKSAVASKLLAIIVSDKDPPTLRATILCAFSEDIGSSFANQVMMALIIPYIVALSTPASREMMQAIVKFAELHWRASIKLFDDTGKKGSINGGMAEVLVRVAAVMKGETAMQSLKAFCSLNWGEDGIRVVEALIPKCKEQRGVAALIVPSMERNILGLEASVRFGKLLFTVARDLPEIATTYDQEMESILGRSKVFLAKRASKLLKEKSKTHSTS